MKFVFFILVLFVSLLTSVLTAVEPRLESYPKERVRLFLLAGQSNMAGRGAVSEVDVKIHPRVFALSKEGEWVPAVDPIHYDKRAAGVGLGKTFAITLAEQNPDIVIGLIPAACGGSPISTWEPGGYHDQTKSHPYDDAIARTQRAMEHGVLKGILWHQGESNCNPDGAIDYDIKLTAVMDRFREDLDAADVPILIGQLGPFFAVNNPVKPEIEAAQITLAESSPLIGFVLSDGLESIGDKTHFNAESLREFGRRYAAAYLELRE